MQVYVTDPDWIAVLKAHGIKDNVNFWRKDLRTLNLQRGARFYFKVRSQTLIVSRGTFDRMEERSLKDAWTTFGVRNGVTSYEQFRERAQPRRIRARPTP
jgi:hypothetical protein